MTQLSKRNTTSRSRKTLKNVGGGRRLKSGEIAGISVAGSVGLLAALHQADKKRGWGTKMLGQEEVINDKIRQELHANMTALAQMQTQLQQQDTEMHALIQAGKDVIDTGNKKNILAWTTENLVSMGELKSKEDDTQQSIKHLQNQLKIIYRDSTYLGRLLTKTKAGLERRKRLQGTKKEARRQFKEQLGQPLKKTDEEDAIHAAIPADDEGDF